MSRANFLRKAFQASVLVLMTILCGYVLVRTVLRMIDGSVRVLEVVGGAVVIFILLFLLFSPIIEQRLEKRWKTLSRVAKLTASGFKILISTLYLFCYFMVMLFFAVKMPVILFVAFVILVVDNIKMGNKLRSLEEKLEKVQSGVESSSNAG